MLVTPSRLRALETARRCAELGARQATIASLTGLAPKYILRSVYTKGHPVPRGRPRYCEDFYFRVAAHVKAAASLLASRYRTLTGEGVLPSDALIAAFRHFQAVFPTVQLSFDQAYFLIANLDGIWVSSSRTLALARCPLCGSDYLTPEGPAHSHPPDGCPACRAQWAICTHSPATCAPVGHAANAAATIQPVDRDIARAKLFCLLDDLGASPKVRATLLDDPRTATFRAPAHRNIVTTACLTRPLALHRWSVNSRLTERVQLAVFALGYRSTQQLGAPRIEALCSAVAKMRSTCQRFDHPVKFDRCFEVAALLDGAWGIPTPRLELDVCRKCGSHYLLSLDEERRSPCPFCALRKRHRVLLRTQTFAASI